jgi:hypothetical protein
MAIVEAHPDVERTSTDEERAAPFKLCPACRATLEVASTYAEGGAIPHPWPNPLLAVFEAARG